jgi:hypothetical protein
MILLLATLALLQSDPPAKGEPVSFAVIDKGGVSGFQETQERFITAQDEWIQLWARRQANLATKKPHPPIDFDRDVVLVATLGMKNSGGYSIEIARIVKTKDDIQVFVKRTAPPEGAKLAAAQTSPFVLARMKKPDRPVTFLDEEKK